MKQGPISHCNSACVQQEINAQLMASPKNRNSRKIAAFSDRKVPSFAAEIAEQLPENRRRIAAIFWGAE